VSVLASSSTDVLETCFCCVTLVGLFVLLSQLKVLHISGQNQKLHVHFEAMLKKVSCGRAGEDIVSIHVRLLVLYCEPLPLIDLCCMDPKHAPLLACSTFRSEFVFRDTHTQLVYIMPERSQALM
jgi:hypothetical protein